MISKEYVYEKDIDYPPDASRTPCHRRNATENYLSSASFLYLNLTLRRKKEKNSILCIIQKFKRIIVVLGMQHHGCIARDGAEVSRR